ncbi:hypothetical protein [Shouchella shacheensis]|uniref:hypothetical protein n=1 Tax=Shouchella shacheensis TaxID=1649580 RepID=UPI000740140B|nr:hypothetical protein [Shouchella shacheensis]
MKKKEKKSLKILLLNGLVLLTGILFLVTLVYNLLMEGFNWALTIFMGLVFIWVSFWRLIRKRKEAQ